MLSHLKDGTVTLWALCRVEPYLQEGDGAEILAAAGKLSRRDLEEYVLRLAERARRRTPVDEPSSPIIELFSERVPSPPESPVPKDQLSYSSPDRIRISFEASSALKEKLERVGNLLSNRLQSRRLEELIEALADLAIRGLDPSRKSPRRAMTVKGNPRRVPWHVRKAVWTRDGGRSAYVAADGTRCAATRRLQYDHVKPWALGGRSDEPANIRLLCRAHNLHLARQVFGGAVPTSSAR